MQKFRKFLVQALHYPGLVMFIIIATFFIVLTYYTFTDLIVHIISEGFNYQYSLEKIFKIFLFVELIAAIKLYFQNNYHFPLRFLIYIGITDVIRRMIISIDDATQVLLYSCAIVVLLLALLILEKKGKYINKHSVDDLEI